MPFPWIERHVEEEDVDGADRTNDGLVLDKLFEAINTVLEIRNQSYRFCHAVQFTLLSISDTATCPDKGGEIASFEPVCDTGHQLER